jgi:hypothetical protein
MHARLVFALSLLVMVIPAFSQSGISQRTDQRLVARDQAIHPEEMSAADRQAFRQRAILHDVEELTALSASLQSDLQKLEKGLLTKELPQNLKKVEKLSKKLRQEVGQ